ncbi:MAG: Asp-tRNA(Asn)/Glu-tRNA(Gln) amidotransferase subunit GatA [Blastochloris viridis]|uniref:Glutamyl-tRNA(Gln) amidotransferase subunit A n=1 Tax=Blastochloris viridis TaxID=1079 RepID=A0A6N4REU7_BLAVI|nr:MAG: Asp-tRNA(Asn)/Glu-tRNA(Gln) amidotransferase subunit GatA [Blastochloris viridis]
MSQELLTLTATEALAKLHNKEVSSVELTQAHLSRIEARKSLNTYLTVNTEGALSAAKAADAAIAKGETQKLTGLPLGIKDLFCTNGVRTTAASKFLDNFVPAYESTVTQKLWDAGAVNLGKLNMDEFAMGGSGENSGYGPARNPWDDSRVPGGSSSGSAAAVADYQCYAATGSDTGGSIRQPAAFTGLVGIKPTYGRCSRWGMVAFASSLDQAGFLTRTVEDAALLMEVISGHDPKDSTSSPQAVPAWRESLGKLNLKGLRIGLPKEYFIEGLDPKIRAIIENATRQFEGEGAAIKQISLPHTQYAPAAYYIVAPAEAASNLARYDGIRYGVRVEGKNLVETYLNSRSAGFGSEVKRRIMIGNYALSSGYYDAFYTKAMQTRTLISQDFDKAFEEVDVIFAPTAPTAAYKIGTNSADPIAMYLGDAFTIPTSLAGLPGLSVNAGTVEEDGVRLPVGLQIIGPRWNEQVILQVAHAWEQLAGITMPPFAA